MLTVLKFYHEAGKAPNKPPLWLPFMCDTVNNGLNLSTADEMVHLQSSDEFFLYPV